MKDKLLNKKVIIMNGQFKGQKGRCTHVNGEQAEVEMSIRAKKVHLPLSSLILDDSNALDNQFK